jgi:TonB-linked SusC/RagA family outer membrane protein
MKTYKVLFFCIVYFIFNSGAFCQEAPVLKGKIFSSYRNGSVAGAEISLIGNSNIIKCDSLGNFSFDSSLPQGTLIKVWAPGYYDVTLPYSGKDMVITLIPKDKFRYNQDEVIPFQDNTLSKNYSVIQNLNSKDFEFGTKNLENIIQPAFSGLQVINKSGMPGEGAMLNFRGIRSLLGNNSPIVILNGVPYLPDMNESCVIGGYSGGVYGNINLNDIVNVTFLKGAEASMYGSLGSNGVLVIETSKASDLDTKIEYSGQFGYSRHTKNIPLLNTTDFKSMIGDIATTKYSDISDILTDFPFLEDNDDYYYKFLYNNNTNWQSQIYQDAIETSHNLRVKGGDAIAKYDLSVGYNKDQGVLKSTNLQRYNVRLNANVNLSRKVEVNTSIGVSNETSRVHEQGMLDATNPILASYYEAPILSPFLKDADNNLLPDYDTVFIFHVSNPLAAVKTIEMKKNMYDVTFNGNINYKLNRHLKISAIFGVNYNYNRQTAFIPGKTSKAIVALEDSLAENTERGGSGYKLDYYYNLNGSYNQNWGMHSIICGAGIQVLPTKCEFDAGSGRNTSSDFYKTLSYVESNGKKFTGYVENWNWMNMFSYFNYSFNRLLYANVNLSVDGASSTGKDTKRYGIFPSGRLTYSIKNMSFLQNSKLLNLFNIYTEYDVTGNSRFSSNLGRYYYSTQRYITLSGIVRGNIPNTGLSWETTSTYDIGIELAVLRNRISGSFNYYNSYTDNVIIAKSISPVFGTSSLYDNAGEISNKGIEASLNIYLIETPNYGFTLGGTISKNKNKLESLGGAKQQISTLDDGSSIISRVGENPYCFYGYQTQGVFSTQTEADAANLTNYNNLTFSAGDVKFKDINGDNIIDDKDKVILGKAAPDFFGTLYAQFRVKNIELTADFSYSVGNKMYNAVRRSLESMSNYYNQSQAVTRRWTHDGQVTDIPRAYYGDPLGNSRFSDRWIEDASYIRLNNVTLSYEIKHTLFKLVRGGDIFITGENLFTLSKYLGLDPVNAYSYDTMLQGFDYAKLALPTTIKFGVKMQF